MKVFASDVMMICWMRKKKLDAYQASSFSEA